MFAQEEARAAGADRIATPMLVLGILRAGGIGAEVLREDFHVDEVEFRTLVQGTPVNFRGEELRAGDLPNSGDDISLLPFTAQTRKVLEGSLREALGLGHNYIETEHILLALARSSSMAAILLRDVSVTAEDVSGKVIRTLSRKSDAKPEPQPPESATERPSPSAVKVIGWLRLLGRLIEDIAVELESTDA